MGPTTFVNTTAATVAAFTADADPAPLLRYLTQLRRAAVLDLPLPQGTTTLTSAARATRVHVVVPLLVRGTVGGRRFRAGARTVHCADAREDRRVGRAPGFPAAEVLTGLSGRQVLARATKLALTVGATAPVPALSRRIPIRRDPRRRCTPTARPHAHRVAVAVQPAPSGRDWTTTILVAAGLLLAAAAGLAVWARS